MTIFLKFCIHITSIFAHKMSLYKCCCMTLFQILIKCDHAVSVKKKRGFKERMMYCGKLGKDHLLC